MSRKERDPASLLQQELDKTRRFKEIMKFKHKKSKEALSNIKERDARRPSKSLLLKEDKDFISSYMKDYI